MGKKIKWNGAALLAPEPCVMVSCGGMGEGESNIITIGWTGILATKPPKTYISVRPTRHSYAMIEKSGEFVINLPTTAMCREVDFCGVRSGKDVDKIAKCGFHLEPSDKVSAPLLSESPVSLSCRVTQKIALGSHDMFLAEILSVAVDERYLDSKGKLNLQQSGLLAYAHGEYFSLGRKLGAFGYSVKKKKHPPRKAKG